MRIHSDIITEAHVTQALNAAKNAGLVAHCVYTDRLTTHGSRKRKGAVDVTLGSTLGESFISSQVLEYLEAHGATQSQINKAKRRASRTGGLGGAGASPDLSRSATWHEWGAFIAELFAIDPEAIIGQYVTAAGFHWDTYNDGRLRIGFDGGYHVRMYDFLEDVEDWEERTGNYNYWA